MKGMERIVGTVSRGVRAPIIRQGDDIVRIVVDSVVAAAWQEDFPLHDRDIVAVTEAVVARAQGNYATVAQIAEDVKQKLGGETVGIVFPILSRNRFSIVLKGIASGAKKVVIQLSYPSDEVGNHLFDLDTLDASGVDPWRDVLDEKTYREKFGYTLHPFTGVDYVAFYRELVTSCGAACEFVFSNDPTSILAHTDSVLCCDIHSRERTKKKLIAAGAKRCYMLTEIMTSPINGSGYNERYGLLGTNKATEDTVKLFPRDCQPVVDAIQQQLYERTGSKLEVMVYGDGAFKDPIGKIWELADPVVSPAYTAGLEGQPNEVKLKYLADNEFKNLSGDALKSAIKDYIRHKDADLVGKMASEGTTPRRLTDLIGSLCDLTSGSGDKGTPIVLIQGYFDNYTVNAED